MTRKLTALGGDVFAGLFAVGVRQAGFEVLGHLEHTGYGTATAQLNWPDLDIRVGPHTWDPHKYRGKVDFMFTNPPCAAWSSFRMTSKEGWRQRGNLLSCVTDLVDAGLIVRPKAWCWESVINAWRHGREFVLEQAQKWMATGYHVTLLLQDNAYLGTPQRRPRLFVIAHRYPLVWPKLTRATTVEEALRKVKRAKTPGPAMPELSPKWMRLWELSESANGVLRRPFDLGEAAHLKGPNPLNTVKRLKLDEPAPVMLASFMRLHPTEPRMLNWDEWLALCGLPPTWKTAQRSSDSATRELARAVMPPVGRWLAMAVRDGLEQRPLNPKRPVCRLVDLRDPERLMEELVMTYAPPPVPPQVEWNPAGPVAPSRVPRPARSSSVNPRRPGSGVRVREMLQQGMATTAILDVIHKEFPASKATSADVSWNRRKLRQLASEF